MFDGEYISDLLSDISWSLSNINGVRARYDYGSRYVTIGYIMPSFELRMFELYVDFDGLSLAIVLRDENDTIEARRTFDECLGTSDFNQLILDFSDEIVYGK